MSSIFVVAYTTSVQPFIDDSDDILDIFNEFSIMILCYGSVAYSQFVPSNETKYQVGWFAVGVFSINLIGNISFILIKTSYMLFMKIKNWY